MANPREYEGEEETKRRRAVERERERCAQVAEWFHNVEKFTAADVAKRIRDKSA